MVKSYVKLSVSPETKKLVMEDYKKQLMKEHTEMKGLNITEDFVVRQLVLSVLKVDYEHY